MMDPLDSLWLLIGLAVLATPVLAIVGFVRTLTDRRLIEELRATLSEQSRQTAALREAVAARHSQETAEAPPPTEAPPPPTEAPPPHAPEISAPEPVAVGAEAPTPPPIETTPPPVPPPVPEPMPAARAARAREDLESALTSRWFVWLGALAIALAGVFLVKYAIEEQLLTPAARIVLGLLLGLGLAVAGEVLRRKPLQRAIAAVRPNHVPPALTASGLFVAFASIYAAYSLYALVGPMVAFAGLALIALLAVGLSLLQGRFVALTGLLGAFAAPAMVTTPNPSVWALFTYLLVVELACLAVARYQAWWWFAIATLAGVALWPLLWMADAISSANDALPLGLFLLFSACAYVLLPRGLPSGEAQENLVEDLRRMPAPEKTVAIAGGVIGFLFFVVADAADFNSASLIVSALGFLLYLFAGRRDGYVDILAVIAAAVAIAMVAAMPVPGALTLPQPLMHGPAIPPELSGFAITASIFGALFAVAGFIALWGARRPAVWAGVSAGVPVAVLTIGYWRMIEFGVDLKWAAIAVVLAGIALAAAERVERYRAARGLDVSLGLYAAAVVALIGLAAAMSLRQAWLSVALSLQLPALGWISRHVSARAIRILAGVVVSVVIVRLVLNYNILDYPAAAGFNWIVYGYGIPAIACLVGARTFAKAERDALVVALEAAGLAFAVLLVSLEIRIFVVGSLAAARYPLLEQSLQSIAWLSIGTVLAWRDTRMPNAVARYGGRILLAVAAVQVMWLQLVLFNPLETGEAIGAHPLLNVLSFAYLVPALFAFALAMRLPGEGAPRRILRAAAAVAGIVLLFADISFEIRRAFHGAVLTTPSHGDAELYTYSVAWLVFAGVLLGLGLATGRALVRYAGLAVLMIVALKVFLVDMSDLTGLYRVASFLGLGLSLVGIGYLYQRFVTAAPQGS